MTTTIALVVAGVCLALAIYAFFRQQELATDNLQQKEVVTRLERDNKKLQQSLDTQGKKLSKQSGVASKKKNKAQGKQERLDQQQSQLQKVRSELKEAQEKVQTMSRDLNRVRIDREEMRQKLASAEDRSAQAAAAPKATAASAPEAPEKQASSEDGGAHKEQPREEAPRPKMSLGKIERDLERAEADRQKAFDRVDRYKQALVARESELRDLRRRNEHNRRAYIITQLQLDLANDELYVMQHGEPPPYKQADKQQKRAALRPEQPETKPLEILNRDNPIDLTAVGDVEELPEVAEVAEVPVAEAPVVEAKTEAPVVETPAKAEAPAKAEVAEAPVEDKEVAPTPKAGIKKRKSTKAAKAAAADMADEEGPGAGFSLAALAKPDESEIDKPSQVRRPSARGSLLEQLRGRPGIRKKNPTGTNRAVAPPRPEAPPRPNDDD